jgi:hypothetical protein
MSSTKSEYVLEPIAMRSPGGEISADKNQEPYQDLEMECAALFGCHSNSICAGKHCLFQRCKQGGDPRVQGRCRWCIFRKGVWNWWCRFSLELSYMSQRIRKSSCGTYWSVPYAERMWEVSEERFWIPLHSSDQLLATDKVSYLLLHSGLQRDHSAHRSAHIW